MYINNSTILAHLNDGFMICVDYNKFICIRDLNFNKITVPHPCYYNQNIILKFNSIRMDNGFLYLGIGDNEIYYRYKTLIENSDFNQYRNLYHSQKQLFHHHVNDFIYKVPNNIDIMLKHTTLLSNDVKLNCLLMLDLLLYDISTIILPLTLELVRLDYHLYSKID